MNTGLSPELPPDAPGSATPARRTRPGMCYTGGWGDNMNKNIFYIIGVVVVIVVVLKLLGVF